MIDEADEEAVQLAYDKIPVRNVWLLFLYAHDLAQFQGSFDAEVEDSPNFKSLIARLLCHVLETRLRRNLSHGYRKRKDTLKRLRGRIDILKTHSHGLLRRGEIACRFEELTIDTPRNRLLRAALNELGGCLDNHELVYRSKALASTLGRVGVSGIRPSRAEVASDQIGRHEAGDRLMVSLARAVFDLILPTEQKGSRILAKAHREDTEFRRLFERAIGNFFSVELPKEKGWQVDPSKRLKWPTGTVSSGIDLYLPTMVTDIILENGQEDRRIIIDTKFTDILTKSQFGDGHRFKTSHIYQLYAYLRSQECNNDPRSLYSEGILLYPSISFDVDEVAEIQGHIVRFCTVDLSAPSNTVVERLRNLPLDSRIRRRDCYATKNYSLVAV